MNFIRNHPPGVEGSQVAYAQLNSSGDIDKSISWDDLTFNISYVVSMLSNKARPRDTALLIFNPGLEFVASFLGCLSAGIIPVPVPALDSARLRHSLPRLQKIIRDSDSRMILTDSMGAEKITSALISNKSNQNEVIEIIPVSLKPLTDQKSEFDVFEGGDNEIAYLQYTSGSTGNPKGVEITHNSLIKHCESLAEAWRYNEESVSVTWMPHFHDYGLVDGLLMPYFNQTPCYIMSPVGFIKRPIRWLEALSSLGGTHTQAPNFAYSYCVEKIKIEKLTGHDLSGVKVFSNGAEPVRNETLVNFYKKFRPLGVRKDSLYPAYGLAEATLLVCTKPHHSKPKALDVNKYELENNQKVLLDRPGKTKSIVSCGVAIKGTEVIIVEPNSGEVLGEDYVGEIWVSSEGSAQGYWQRPELSKDVFNNKIGNQVNGKNFLRTGDLGFIHVSEIYPTGRLKDLIIINGVNIYPQDIEDLVFNSIPEIRSSCAAAFSVNGVNSDELIFLGEVNNKVDDHATTAKNICSLITEETSVVPSAVVLVAKGGVQKTSSGKIQRNACREKWLDEDMPIVFEWSKSEQQDGDFNQSYNVVDSLEPWIINKLAVLLNKSVTSIGYDDSFSDLGLDSTSATNFIGQIEDHLPGSKELPISFIWEHPTPRQLVKAIEQSGANKLIPSQKNKVKLPVEKDRRIAVVGLSCKFPGANGPEDFWELLCSSLDSISILPAERQALRKNSGIDAGFSSNENERAGYIGRIEYFDAEFFGISEREARVMDPQQRLILECVRDSFERAAISPEKWSGKKVGVFIGSSSNDYGDLILNGSDSIEAYSSPGKSISIIANRVSYLFDFRGPSMTIDTACSSSMVAVSQAVESLRNGVCDLALAGGVNLLINPKMTAALQAGGMLSEEGSPKVFDENADGYVRGEGVGVVLLKRIADAENDGDPIRGCILGCSINQDGKSNGLTAPNPASQVDVMKTALQDASLGPEDINYVEAHGTGTPLGDPIEIDSIRRVYGLQEKCFVGSVKSTIGHLEGAAGIAGLIKTLLILEQGIVPAQANLMNLSERVADAKGKMDIPLVAHQLNGSDCLRAGVSSFGFGGTNAHVILSSYLENRSSVVKHIATKDELILPLSAHNETALDSLLRSYQDILNSRSIDPFQLCASAALGRSFFSFRTVALGENRDELVSHLNQILQEKEYIKSVDDRPGITWLFSGQGSQYAGMGSNLLRYPLFRKHIEPCAQIVRDLLSFDILNSISDSKARLVDTRIVQPIIFSVEYALAKMYIECGMKPDIMIGHSLGELSAACVGGVFDLNEMLPFVCERANLMSQLTAEGAMLSANISLEAAISIVDDNPDISLSAINGQESVVFGGKIDSINALSEFFKTRGDRSRILNVSHAFHTQMIEPILEDLRIAAKKLNPCETKYKLFSNLTGKLISGLDMTADYWVMQARSTVLFGKSLKASLETTDCFIEMGPGAALASMVEGVFDENESNINRSCIPGYSKKRPFPSILAKVLRAHFIHGSKICWEKIYDTHNFLRCALPDYTFTRKPYWISTSGSSDLALLPNKSFNLNRQLALPGSEKIASYAHLSEDLIPLIGEHKVFNQNIIPGAGLLSLVANLPKIKAAQGFSFELDDVTFLHPLVFVPHEVRTVQILSSLINKKNNDEFELISYRLEDNGNPFSVHMRGNLCELKNKPKLIAKSVSELKRRCSEKMSSDFYSHIWQKSIDLGDSFRWIKSISKGNDEFLIRLERPKQTYNEIDSLPGLFDSILQGITAWQPMKKNEALVPFAIDNMWFDCKAIEKKYWVWIRIEDCVNTREIKAEFEIYDINERVIGQIKGFRARLADSKNFLRTDNRLTKKGVYHLNWEKFYPSKKPSKKFEKLIVVSSDEHLGASLVNRVRLSGVPGDNVSFYGTITEFCESSFENSNEKNPKIKNDLFCGNDGDALLAIIVDSNKDSMHLPSAVTDSTVSLAHDLDKLYRCLSISSSLEVFLVTKGYFDIESSGSSACSASAASVGYARCARKESINCSWRIIDIDPKWTRDQTVEQLGELFFTNHLNQDELAIRDGDYYFPKISKIEKPEERLKPFQANSSALITGGLGGIGLVVAEKLVERGISSIWLIGRSQPNNLARNTIAALQKRNVNVYVRQVNVSDYDAISTLLHEIRESKDLLRSIYHCAGMLEDRPSGEHSRSSLDSLIRPKLLGALLLDQLTTIDNLEEFVLFSSAAAIFGNYGQSGYAVANEAMASIGADRAERNLPSLVIDWGPWKDVGMAARGGEPMLDFLSTQGYQAISNSEGQELLSDALLCNQSRVLSAILDTKAFNKELVNTGDQKKNQPENSKGSESLSVKSLFMEKLIGMDATSIEQQISDYLHSEVHTALEGSGKKSFGNQTPLFDMGLDSLGAVELRNRVVKTLGVKLRSTVLFDYPNIDSLSKYLTKMICDNAETYSISAVSEDKDYESATYNGLDHISDDQINDQPDVDIEDLLRQELDRFD